MVYNPIDFAFVLRMLSSDNIFPVSLHVHVDSEYANHFNIFGWYVNKRK